MATATQIATRALKRLRIVAAGQTPSAEAIEDATEALDAMIAAWEATSLSGDVLPLDSRFEQGLVAMLAVRLAGDYGKQPDAVLLRDAEQGQRALDGAFFAVPQQKFDSAVVYTSQDTSPEIIIGTSNTDYAAWEASTAYLVREHVENLGHIYECTTAGTSASSGGPTGTTTGITDGTAVWAFRRVAGT